MPSRSRVLGSGTAATVNTSLIPYIKSRLPDDWPTARIHPPPLVFQLPSNEVGDDPNGLFGTPSKSVPVLTKSRNGPGQHATVPSA